MQTSRYTYQPTSDYQRVRQMVAQIKILTGYTPAECRAIEVHKYFLGIERCCDPPLDEAVASWEARYARDWRCRRMREDAEAQLREIENFRQEKIRETSRPVDFTEAAREWVRQYGAEWREHREAEVCSKS
jgi:hypothetical protein